MTQIWYKSDHIWVGAARLGIQDALSYPKWHGYWKVSQSKSKPNEHLAEFATTRSLYGSPFEFATCDLVQSCLQDKGSHLQPTNQLKPPVSNPPSTSTKLMPTAMTTSQIWDPKLCTDFIGCIQANLFVTNCEHILTLHFNVLPFPDLSSSEKESLKRHGIFLKNHALKSKFLVLFGLAVF